MRKSNKSELLLAKMLYTLQRKHTNTLNLNLKKK